MIKCHKNENMKQDKHAFTHNTFILQQVKQIITHNVPIFAFMMISTDENFKKIKIDHATNSVLSLTG